MQSLIWLILQMKIIVQTTKNETNWIKQNWIRWPDVCESRKWNRSFIRSDARDSFVTRKRLPLKIAIKSTFLKKKTAHVSPPEDTLDFLVKSSGKNNPFLQARKDTRKRGYDDHFSAEGLAEGNTRLDTRSIIILWNEKLKIWRACK